MTENPECASFSETYLAELAERFGLAPKLLSEIQLTGFDFRKLDRAAIFYHGSWSGPSAAALKLLCVEMSGAQNQFPVLLVNADSFNSAPSAEMVAKAKELFGPVIGAWGETCWIKNGAIAGQDILHPSPKHQFKKDFASVLRQCDQSKLVEPHPQTPEEMRARIQARIAMVNA